MIVHKQRTEHDTYLLIREDETEPQHYVEVAVAPEDGDQPILLSLTPEEARQFADALLNSSQRIEDRLPHRNS